MPGSRAIKLYRMVDLHRLAYEDLRRKLGLGDPAENGAMTFLITADADGLPALRLEIDPEKFLPGVGTDRNATRPNGGSDAG